MPRLSALARGYGSWNGDLEQEKQSYLKDIATPILPQYLSNEHQPFYKEKTVKFPIRTKANHDVIKTILAEAERIKSAKNRNHDDPPTIAEEIQSKVPMTQPSRAQSGRSHRWKSRPEFRTNHRSVNNHLRTRSAPGSNKRLAVKPGGELQLPKTFVTRKGAMVLFTAPSTINFTKEGRCFSSNYKTKKDISNLSLSLGTIGKLCSSVLQYGEPTWEDDDLDSLASQQFHKTCMRFIRDEEGQECLDYRVQPGADFNFYLHDMQTRAVMRNLTRCNSAHFLTSSEAAEELNEALDNMDNNHHYKHDDSDGKHGLITADANRLAESISRASTSTPDKSHRFRETFSRPSTTQDSKQRAAEMGHMTLAAGEMKSRLGSGRSMTSSRTSTPLSCAKLTASLKSTNYLGRAVTIAHTASGFENDDSKIIESEMEDTNDSGDRMLFRQHSVKSLQSVTSVTAESRPHSRATDGSGDAGHDEVFEDEVIQELGDESEEQYFEDDDVASLVSSRRCSLLSSAIMGDYDEEEIVDLMQHQGGRSSQLSRRSRRSSSQRTKTPDANTSRRSSVKLENGLLSEFEDDTELSKIPSNGEGELEEENEEIQGDGENNDRNLQAAIPTVNSAELEQLIENDNDADSSVAALGAVISRPQTAGSSHHSVRSLHRPASCTSNVESSVDFNNEPLQNIDGLVLDAIESQQHDGEDGEQNLDPSQIETHTKSSTGITEESSTPEEVALSKTKEKQSIQSPPVLTEGSESSMQPLKPLQSSLAPLASNGVSKKETPLLDNAKMDASSVKEQKQSQQVEKFPVITPPRKMSSPEPKPPPSRMSSPKVSSPMQINPVHTKQTVAKTPKPPIMKAPLPQTSPAAMVNEAVTPINGGALPKMAPVNKTISLPMKNVNSGPLKAIASKHKSRGGVKKKVIGGPQFNDGLLKETYEEPGADEIEKMIQEELEKDLKEQGLIEISEEVAGAPSSTDNLKSGKVETQVGLDNQQENTEINLDTDDETIAKEVKKINKGKKKSKKQILKEREELRELKRQERRLKEEEAKAMKARKKAAEKEKMMAEEAARRKKIEMEEEIQEAEREAQAAKEAEEQARLMLLESRKQAREEREAKRKAEMDRKKEERNRQREHRKKMEEAARKREQEMKEKLATVEDIRRQKEIEREMEWEREEKEREEREEMERQEEEEKRKMEEEEERIRELEKEAEEEALARLVREREEAEQRMKAAALEAQRQKEAEEQLRLEEQRKQEEEAERRKLIELEEERLLEIERQRILQIKRIEDEARARVLKKLEGKRIWAMRRRDANVQRFAHLNSVRRTQGMTRPWVFSYYVHWPRQTYEKKLPSAKKKQRRPTRPPKPPAETPVSQAAS